MNMPHFPVACSVHVLRHFNVSLNPIFSVYVQLLRRVNPPTRLSVNSIHGSHPPAALYRVITAYVSGHSRFSFGALGPISITTLRYICTSTSQYFCCLGPEVSAPTSDDLDHHRSCYARVQRILSLPPPTTCLTIGNKSKSPTDNPIE